MLIRHNNSAKKKLNRDFLSLFHRYARKVNYPIIRVMLDIVKRKTRSNEKEIRTTRKRISKLAINDSNGLTDSELAIMRSHEFVRFDKGIQEVHRSRTETTFVCDFVYLLRMYIAIGASLRDYLMPYDLNLQNHKYSQILSTQNMLDIAALESVIFANY